jgi:hypothetical protein
MRRLIVQPGFAVVLFFSLLPALAAQSTPTRGDELVPGSSIQAPSSFPLVKLSTDTFHNSDSEHKTEVEPDTFAWGSTIVSTFQVARVYGFLAKLELYPAALQTNIVMLRENSVECFWPLDVTRTPVLATQQKVCLRATMATERPHRIREPR